MKRSLRNWWWRFPLWLQVIALAFAVLFLLIPVFVFGDGFNPFLLLDRFDRERTWRIRHPGHTR